MYKFFHTYINSANAIIAISNYTRDDILRIHRCDEAKVKVVYNSISLIELPFSKFYQQEKYVSELSNLCTSNGYQAVALPMPEGCYDYGIKKRIPLPLSPLDWYALIKYSNGYIGERMHPIVVAIHNSVPFFCFDEYGYYQKSLLGLKKKYIEESSKTYHIVHLAKLDQNIYSYKKHNIPTPQEVWTLLMGFDKEKCSYFSKKYQELYEMSMLKAVEI